MVGYSAAELYAMTFADIMHPDDLEADLAQLEIPDYHMEKRYIRRDGQVIWAKLSVTDEVSGPPDVPRTRLTAALRQQVKDVTHVKAVQEELQRRALYDPLTGLANLLDIYGDPQTRSGLFAAEASVRSLVHVAVHGSARYA